jgi:hypothetical protein
MARQHPGGTPNEGEHVSDRAEPPTDGVAVPISVGDSLDDRFLVDEILGMGGVGCVLG